MPSNAPEALLRLKTVMDRTGLSRSGIYKLISENRFVAPVHIKGTRISCWPASAIDAWVRDQIDNAV